MSPKNFEEMDDWLHFNRQLRKMIEDKAELITRGTMGWVPLADVFETENSFIIMAELPGVERADMELVLQGNEIRIKGSKKKGDELNSHFHCIERQFGEFMRIFQFDRMLSEKGIEASMKHGVLTIKINKGTSKQKREIHIK